MSMINLILVDIDYMKSIKKFKKLKFLVMDDWHDNVFFYNYVNKK